MLSAHPLNSLAFWNVRAPRTRCLCATESVLLQNPSRFKRYLPAICLDHEIRVGFGKESNFVARRHQGALRRMRAVSVNVATHPATPIATGTIWTSRYHYLCPWAPQPTQPPLLTPSGSPTTRLWRIGVESERVRGVVFKPLLLFHSLPRIHFASTTTGLPLFTPRSTPASACLH